VPRALQRALGAARLCGYGVVGVEARVPRAVRLAALQGRIEAGELRDKLRASQQSEQRAERAVHSLASRAESDQEGLVVQAAALRRQLAGEGPGPCCAALAMPQRALVVAAGCLCAGPCAGA
jgi:hypothetical protein